MCSESFWICDLKSVSNSGLLCRCHACGIAVCFAADLRIVYIAVCFTAVMLVELQLALPLSCVSNGG